MMNRKERRVAAHKAFKLARKAKPPVAPSPLKTAPPTASPVTTFVLLSSEDPIGFESLKASLAEEHQPSTETESILINTMAEFHWLANRAQTLQNTCFDSQTGQITDTQMFSLYLRYQTTHTRAFHKSLNDLVKLRAERRKTENGFEAQTRQKEELRLKNERHDMKKQTHYWDVLKKDAETCFRIGQNVSQNRKLASEDPGFEAQYTPNWPKTPLSGADIHVCRAETHLGAFCQSFFAARCSKRWRTVV